LLSRPGEWKFPPAVGVITTPTLRPDGSILTTLGYDPATRLILMHPPAMPEIPETPSKDQAREALDLLNSLLTEFPFVDEASRSVALSELITPVARGAMSVAPLHANSAPAFGSGKSYLVDIASAIVSGQPCPVISAGYDKFELEKRLGAAMLRGQAMISIDNVDGELRGEFLCQIIERPVVKVRPLGFSTLVQIESKATILATGINITPVGRVVRRVLKCSLDPQIERPELRTFQHAPVERVLADRGKYIAAAHYLAAGCPGELPSLASFPDWSRLVRSPLVWLGREDPIQTMDNAREEDPEFDEVRQVFGAWHGALGNAAYSTGDAIKSAQERDDRSQQLIHPELLTTLSEVAQSRSGGPLSPKKLGKWLKRYRNRIAGGLQLISRYDEHNKQNLWLVREPPPPQGDLFAGSAGSCG
jgi:putative DNA primase/helicase